MQMYKNKESREPFVQNREQFGRLKSKGLLKALNITNTLLLKPLREMQKPGLTGN